MADMNFADAIQSILNDPDTGGKIQELMKSLSGEEGAASAPEGAIPDGMPDITKLMKIKSIYDSAMKEEDKRVTLLSALRPYLSDKRSKNLDLIIKFLRLSKIASQVKDTDLLKELF